MKHPWEFTTIIDYSKTGLDPTPVKDPGHEELYFLPGHGYSKGDIAVVFWGAYKDHAIEHVGQNLQKSTLRTWTMLRILKN